MKTFKTLTLRGVKWAFIDRLANQILRFLVLVFLARLLSPNDFGLFAMITVFTSFATLLRNAGFGQALIYKTDSSQEDNHTVFVVNIVIGLILTSLFFFGAPLLASFYDEPLLIELTQAISLIFLIQSISGVNSIELKKKMNFKKLTAIRNISLIVSSLVAIVLAYLGYGVWCLVFKTFVDNCILTVATLFLTSYKPKLKFSIDSFKDLWKYSLQVTLNQIVTYWQRNADNLMIGKFINQKVLGDYNMAYQIMLFPTQNISHVISQVLFPAFSTIKDDLQKIKSIYFKIVQSIALIVFPLMNLIILIPDFFIELLLGEQWFEISNFLPLLALVSIPQSIFSISGPIYLSIGKPQIPLKINLISFPFYILGFYIGIKHDGVLGLIKCYVVLNILFFIPIFYYLSKSLKFSLKKYLINLLPVLFGCLFLSLIILFFKKTITISNSTSFLDNLLIIVSSILVYISIIFLYRKKIHLFEIIRNRK